MREFGTQCATALFVYTELLESEIGLVVTC